MRAGHTNQQSNSATVVLFFGGGIAGTAAALWVGTPLFLLVSGFLVAFASVLIDWLLVCRIPSYYPRAGARVLLVAALAVIVPWAARPSKATMFETAFGVPPPAGLKYSADIRSQGPGDTVILIRCIADEQLIKQLTAGVAFSENVEAMEMLAAGLEWSGFVRRALGPVGIGGEEWRNIAPMAQPRTFVWRTNSDPQVDSAETAVLWDAATGQTYARHFNR